MRQRIVGGLLILLLGGGCGQTAYWYRPNTTLREARDDCEGCDREAEAQVLQEALAYNRERGSVPWGPPPGPWWYFDRCMENRGYRLTPADELPSQVKKRVVAPSPAENAESYPIAGH
jgi:hypothetical protein